MLFAPSVQAKGRSAKTVSSSGVKLSAKSLGLKKGKTKKLKLNNTSKKVVWKSSDSTVAAVNRQGLVKAKNDGSCVITATAGGQKYLCRVKVYTISPRKRRCLNLQRNHDVETNRQKIILAGSSSIRHWKDAAEMFAPYEILNMGIGGSVTKQWLKWYRNLIVAYDPSAVVLYPGAGTELSGARSVKKTATRVCKLLKLLRKELPGVPIYYVSIYCNYNKQKIWDLEQSCNKKVKKYCSTVEDLYYIDVASALINKKGNAPKPGVISGDGEHLNENGYAIWSSRIVPAVKSRLDAQNIAQNIMQNIS